MRITACALLLGVLLATSAVAGQERITLTLAAGASTFDLSGTGTAPLIAARLDRSLHPDVRVEAAMTAARPRQQFGETTTLLAPEAQLKWVPFRLAWGTASTWSLEPYVGLGGGWSWDLRSGRDDPSRVSFSGALGGRLPLDDAGRGGLEAEFRVRYLGTGFNGSLGDFTLGWYWVM